MTHKPLKNLRIQIQIRFIFGSKAKTKAAVILTAFVVAILKVGVWYLIH